jgi:hypothetical protein
LLPGTGTLAFVIKREDEPRERTTIIKKEHED